MTKQEADKEVNMMDESVKISLWKFENLLSKSQKYDMLINKMIETSDLSWSKEWLTFGSSSEISALIRLIEPVIYEARLYDLKIKDKNINKED